MLQDVIIIGGGIVGLATAFRLLEDSPELKVLLVEKEDRLAAHQTGHNSGVLHSGLYYKPGSLKARLCVEGQRSMTEFCEQEGIPFGRSGKIVVASASHEIPAMEELERRGNENGLVGIRRLGSDEIVEF